MPVQSPRDEEDSKDIPDYVVIRLAYRRAWTTKFFACFVFIMMWFLSLLIFTAAITMVRNVTLASSGLRRLYSLADAALPPFLKRPPPVKCTTACCDSHQCLIGHPGPEG